MRQEPTQIANVAEPWSDFIHSRAAEFGALWLGVILAAWLANLITKKVILRILHHLAGKTKSQWDDLLVKHRVFHKLSHLAPAMVFYAAAPYLFAEDFERWANLITRFSTVWMIIAGSRAAAAFLDVVVAVSANRKEMRDKPMGSYAQVVKLLMWLAVSIVVLATLMDRSPWALLTGLGAMTAIILLVFKDSILGFVASIQIASYDMVRVGDWVEMPKFGADGDVIEISLNTVKIQNWDKTISTVPTYAFMSDSFK
ncbi:MAG: mechanosensitive ion channel family protein, partial [Planctomycetota bacterium]